MSVCVLLWMCFCLYVLLFFLMPNIETLHLVSMLCIPFPGITLASSPLSFATFCVIMGKRNTIQSLMYIFVWISRKSLAVVSLFFWLVPVFYFPVLCIKCFIHCISLFRSLSHIYFGRYKITRATVLSVKLTTCIEYSHNFHNNLQMFLDHMYAYTPLSDA